MLFLVEHFDKSECLDLIDTNITKLYLVLYTTLVINLPLSIDSFLLNILENNPIVYSFRCLNQI